MIHEHTTDVTPTPPNTSPEVLQDRRRALLQIITLAANEIKQIDRRLEVLRSQKLEADLLRVEGIAGELL